MVKDQVQLWPSMRSKYTFVSNSHKSTLNSMNTNAQELVIAVKLLSQFTSLKLSDIPSGMGEAAVEEGCLGGSSPDREGRRKSSCEN